MTDPTCPRCQHAKAHGWWGPPRGLTHCRKCHRDWRGTAQAHCVTCCAHFGTYNAADLHLTASGCRPPDTVRTRADKPRLVLDRDKQGAIWREVSRSSNPFAGTTSPLKAELAAAPLLGVAEAPKRG